jgi:UDP-4-amino-4,6-dideoxy-N-acetyl-beta-L-altrosamine N-acetyltransferase
MIDCEFGSLRPIQDDDLMMILSWRNAPNVRLNMYNTHVINSDEHLAWWGRVKSSDNQQYFLYIQNGTPTGVVSFDQIDKGHNRNAFWAFYASPQAPIGTGSRMEIMALDYAFSSLQLHKLCCEVLAFNKPVLKLHEKFGFSTEGVFREQHCHDGSLVDIYRLGILNHEWKARRDFVVSKLSEIQRKNDAARN